MWLHMALRPQTACDLELCSQPEETEPHAGLHPNLMVAPLGTTGICQPSDLSSSSALFTHNIPQHLSQVQ